VTRTELGGQKSLTGRKVHNTKPSLENRREEKRGNCDSMVGADSSFEVRKKKRAKEVGFRKRGGERLKRQQTLHEERGQSK